MLLGETIEMGSQIREMLLEIGAICEENTELFASRTRDREVPVYRDTKSGVIYIDNFYVGSEEYVTGSYRQLDSDETLEDHSDARRRANDFQYLWSGRKVLDWGCGRGNFLRLVNSMGGATSLYGVELQESFIDELNYDGIVCARDLRTLHEEFEICFMFHVLEHLPDPITSLQEVRASLDPQSGLLVVEVPHANDFLLKHLDNRPFRDFTLWSQHLVLHTRESLKLLLTASGFVAEIVFGVQRYGLSNHLQWLSQGKPGGHKSPLAAIEDLDIKNAYASALVRLDANDTLIAIARPV